MIKLATQLVLLLALASCSNSSGGACGLTSTSIGTVTSVTKSANSDPSCPNLTPSEAQYTPIDGGCIPTVSTSSCTATVSCGTLTATETASGSTFAASYMLTRDGDAGTVSCSYNVSGTVP